MNEYIRRWGTASWRDVLRPIRDGIRRYFPERTDPDETKERERKRQADALKGFAYFESFEQLKSWTPEDSDPLQRANTPLLPRSPIEQETGAKVLVCHDFNGGYHDYESASILGADEESFSCEYLQSLETFVYFSHRLVTIPPATWTNTLHRNGVKSLGTFIVERQTRGLETILKFEEPDISGKRTFPVARKLAQMAEFFGFDGWLVNIETAFSRNHWDLEALLQFLQDLQHHLGPHGQLVW
jgi:endo-beta-N-acetylglucosaminidase D